jgi:hypothetical protein
LNLFPPTILHPPPVLFSDDDDCNRIIHKDQLFPKGTAAIFKYLLKNGILTDKIILH